jgi:hypothetical protein
MERLRRRLSPILGRLGPGTLLDVGAGTGSLYEPLPQTLAQGQHLRVPRRLRLSLGMPLKAGVGDMWRRAGTAAEIEPHAC